MPDLQNLLDQIDRLDQEAEAGPWRLNEVMGGDYLVHGDADVAEAWGLSNSEFIALARTALPQLAKALQAVMEVHTPEEFSDHNGDGVMCNECMYDDGTFMLYPCPTVQAITDALGDDDA